MTAVILEIIALLGFLALAVKGPSNRKEVKYRRPGPSTISGRYAVNKHGEIEELLNKEGKKEDY